MAIAHYNLGMTCEQTHDNQKAMECDKEALRIKPELRRDREHPLERNDYAEARDGLARLSGKISNSEESHI